MNAAFSRSSRLTNRREFDRIFSAPEQRSSDRYFTVLGRRCECQAPAIARLGMVVAKKRIARAHERNRIKRIIRESFRQYDKVLLQSDIVVLPKNAAQFADNATLFASLAKHWQRQQAVALKEA